MAKKKRAKKKPRTPAKKAAGGKRDAAGRKMAEIRPCAKCGILDEKWKTDQARRAHQGKCKVKAGKKAAKKKAVPKKRTPQQVGKSSKAKGSGYENTVKRIFALWYGESPEVAKSKNSKFQRTPGSGGTSPSNWPLDIHVPSDFPWAIECKNREGLNNGMEAMERFMTVDQYNVVEWFLEAEKELLDARVVKPALLVFTRNKYPDFVAFRRPEKKDEGHMNIEIPHITLCDGVIGELVVTRLAPLLAKYKLGHWQSMYIWADQKSWRPLG